MTRQLTWMVVGLLAGCSTQVPPGSSSPEQNGTPTAVATRHQAACRLPIGIAWGAPAVTQGSPLSGFLAYPSGSFTPDPSSDHAQSPYHGPNIGVIGSLGVPSYDWPARRWLPIPRALISPDGATYAYTELTFPPAPPTAASGPRFAPPTGTRIHIVDVASTNDHVVLDTTSRWAAVRYSGEWLYLIDAQPEAGPDGSLYALHVSTGEIQVLAAPAASGASSPIEWTVIGSDAAWGSDQYGRLARLDFGTKNSSYWLTNAGTFQLIGLDEQGMPILSGDPFGARLVTAPDQTVEIADTSIWVNDAIADGHGIWLLSDPKVYLWTPGAGLNPVGPGVVQANQTGSLAGPCQ